MRSFVLFYSVIIDEEQIARIEGGAWMEPGKARGTSRRIASEHHCD